MLKPTDVTDAEAEEDGGNRETNVEIEHLIKGEIHQYISKHLKR